MAELVSLILRHFQQLSLLIVLGVTCQWPLLMIIHLRVKKSLH